MFIGDLFVGYNDGKKEAAYRENFENYYFNYGRIYDKVLGKDKFLILGRKGTGKTLLAEYMKKQALLKGGWLCEICSCRNFRFQELFALKTRDVKPNEYAAIWEWLLLIKLGELVIRDVNAKYESVTAIRNFFKNYFFGTKLDMNKVIEVTKKKSISASLFGKLFGAKGESEINSKENQCNYLDYLLEFKEKIFSALSTSTARYDLILDELDDQFRNEELYKSNIISLIKTIDKLNGEFIECGLDVKFLAILRSDIFYILNDADLNKIEQDNSIKINWGSASDSNSPLVNMILVKIKQSMVAKEEEELELKEISKKLFSEKIKVKDKRYDMLSFMLSRTYLRPRDLITFLKCIIDINPQEEKFTAKNLKTAEKEYSEYLIKEIKNEMHGHIDEKIITQSIMLLRQFKRQCFSFEELKEYYLQNKKLYPDLDLEVAMKYLFEFGVVGNNWRDRGKRYFTWSYRENTAIDFNKNFNIHLGLRKALNIS